MCYVLCCTGKTRCGLQVLLLILWTLFLASLLVLIIPLTNFLDKRTVFLGPYDEYQSPFPAFLTGEVNFDRQASYDVTYSDVENGTTFRADDDDDTYRFVFLPTLNTEISGNEQRVSLDKTVELTFGGSTRWNVMGSYLFVQNLNSRHYAPHWNFNFNYENPIEPWALSVQLNVEDGQSTASVYYKLYDSFQGFVDDRDEYDWRTNGYCSDKPDDMTLLNTAGSMKHEDSGKTAKNFLLFVCISEYTDSQSVQFKYQVNKFNKVLGYYNNQWKNMRRCDCVESCSVDNEVAGWSYIFTENKATTAQQPLILASSEGVVEFTVESDGHRLMAYIYVWGSLLVAIMVVTTYTFLCGIHQYQII